MSNDILLLTAKRSPRSHQIVPGGNYHSMQYATYVSSISSTNTRFKYPPPKNSTDALVPTTFQVGSSIFSATPSVDVVSRPAPHPCHLLIIRHGRGTLHQCLPPDKPLSLPLVLLLRLNAVGPSHDPILPFPSMSLFRSTYPTCLASKSAPRFLHHSALHQTFCLSMLVIEWNALAQGTSLFYSI